MDQLSVISNQLSDVSFQSIVLSDKLGAAFLLKKISLHPTPYTPHPTPLKQDLVSVINRQIHGHYRE
ncbi:hypothetical protein [Microcystis sp. LE19-195.1E]|uniref:hypothetical protein n=1 Tax=Microcystis sp. LE19-195.1E TaxID=3016440 RepID=UPI00258CB8E4|nr:hypothetical protein [Microcystis sp. LE19-195.1E]